MLGFKWLTLWVKFGFAKLLNSENLFFPPVCVLILGSSSPTLLLYLLFLSNILSGLSLRSQKSACSSEQANCSLSWQYLRVHVWLFFWWKYLFIWQVKYRPEFCYWKSFFVGPQISSEVKKLLRSCYKQVGVGRKREREHIRMGKINKSYSSSHIQQYFLVEFGAKCQ